MTGRPLPGGLLSRLRPLVAPLLDAVVPRFCLACDEMVPAFGDPLCGSCQRSLGLTLAIPACPRCARSARPETVYEGRCAHCRDDPTWNVQMIVRVGPYDPPLRRLALDLKYRGREVNARFLARLLASRICKQPWIDETTALVPVPMHPLRRLQRPCDHAGVLGEALAREMKIPLRRWLTRSRYAVSQTQMPSKAKRMENAAGCFELSRAGRLQTGLNGETVCLVDNVIVSGATLHECSKALRRGGVRRIYAAIVTKASMPGDPDPLAAGISAASQP